MVLHFFHIIIFVYRFFCPVFFFLFVSLHNHQPYHQHHPHPVCVVVNVIAYMKGGDKLTLNLSGVDAPLISLSPNSPKTPGSAGHGIIAPSSIATAALITFNTPPASPIFDLSSNAAAAADASSSSSPDSAVSLMNNNVTVTHFSDQRGGVVEKISVPSLNIYSHEMSSVVAASPKLDNKTRAQHNSNNNNNPFLNSPVASPKLLLSGSGSNNKSTNPFLGGGHHNSSSVDAENNNNNQSNLVANGRRNGSTSSSAEDNGDLVAEAVETRNNLDRSVGERKRNVGGGVDKNPFRDERALIGSPLMNVKAINVAAAEEDKRNGNAEEIVTVSEIDGGRVAEIIRVSCDKFFV